jgi:hypothetical protein
MVNNPFPEVWVDEDSGVEVPSQNHTIWNNGYSVGFEDCLKAINKNYQIVLELINKGLTPEEIIEHLKEEEKIL